VIKIEVWKCRPAWNSLSASEQNAIIRRFSNIVQRQLADSMRAEGGPYLVQKKNQCVLTWTWELNQPEVARAIQELRLETYFERVSDAVPSPKLTAKRIANGVR
jgi:hypothetical protein